MTEIFLTIYLASVLVTLIIYFPRLLGFRYAFKKIPRLVAQKNRRIAVLVPARGESAVIGDLLSSLDAQSYIRDNYDVYVIVKERSDPTVGIAEKFGAQVCVVPDQRCKGDALHGFFQSRPVDFIKNYDAYAVVDADGILSPDYLKEINNALGSGADIVIPKKLAKNFLYGKKSRSIISNCAALTYPAVDDFGNRYREKKNMPLNICGQGMVISRRIIAVDGGWIYRTVTEDYELKLCSLLRSYKSVYYPHAVLYTEEAVKSGEDFRRRVRWLTGYKQCDKKYKPAIRRAAFEKRGLSPGEREYFFGLAPYFIFMIASAATAIAGIALSAYYLHMDSILWLRALLLLTVMPLGALYLILHIFSIMCMAAAYDGFKKITAAERFFAVLYNPLYMLEYVPVYFAALVKLGGGAEPVWRQTERIVRD